MPVPLKFNYDQLKDLDKDLSASSRAVFIVTQRVLSRELRKIRNELAPLIPRKTGAIRRSFAVSVKRGVSKVVGRLGYIARTTKRTAIAANVMQHGSNVYAKRRAYLWIPLPNNRQADGAPITTAAEVFSNPLAYFVVKTKAGNLIALRKDPDGGRTPLFVLKKHISVRARPIPFEEKVISSMPAITTEIIETIGSVIEAKRAAEQVRE